MKGAIFDADGTIIDSMGMWRSLGRRYLGSLGIDADEGLDSALYIMSLEQGCDYIREHYLHDKTAGEIREGIINIIRDFYFYEVELKPGVRDFLEDLRRRNIPSVIATLGDRELLEAALARNDIAGYFEAIFTCSELGTDKHDAKIFMACAEYLGLEAHEAAVFEDSLYALRTAHEAGFITVGVRDSSNLHDTKSIKAISDYYIEEWRTHEDSTDHSRQ